MIFTLLNGIYDAGNMETDEELEPVELATAAPLML